MHSESFWQRASLPVTCYGIFGRSWEKVQSTVPTGVKGVQISYNREEQCKIENKVVDEILVNINVFKF